MVIESDVQKQGWVPTKVLLSLCARFDFGQLGHVGGAAPGAVQPRAQEQ